MNLNKIRNSIFTVTNYLALILHHLHSEFSLKPKLTFFTFPEVMKFYFDKNILHMQTNPLSNGANLLNEIDQVRNYYEHRRRIADTRNASPLTLLKKSMSYDRQKLFLHEYLKNRKNYSKEYYKRQALKNNEEKDSKMLQNILEYDSRHFVFSLNQNQSENSSLHHNSMVTNNKKSRRVDQQNSKIHFRITKTRSLYSHLFPCKNSWGVSSQLKTNDRINNFINGGESEKKAQTEEEEPNVEQIQKSVRYKLTDQLTIGSQKIQFQLPSFKGLGNSAVSDKKQKQTLQSPLIRSSTTRRVCERARREKLAQNLFQKKQKWQSKVLSKLKIQKG